MAKDVPAAESSSPAATIFPSAWRATALARPETPRETMAHPSPPKLVSRLPSGQNRASAKDDWEPAFAVPATTILPSPCMAIADPVASSYPVGTGGEA